MALVTLRFLLVAPTETEKRLLKACRAQAVDPLKKSLEPFGPNAPNVSKKSPRVSYHGYQANPESF